MPLLPFIYTFPRLCCLTPLLLSLSVATKRNAFFFHACFAVCALKMPNRNRKKARQFENGLCSSEFIVVAMS